nr:MAG TPA: portal protein [Caudoviricetes sp.]
MKRLIPVSRFRGKKDNSDSVKARLRQKGADKTNLQLLTRAENAWQALYDLRKRRERNINYCFIDQWSDWVYDEKGKLVRESSRIAKRTGGVALQNNHLIKIVHSLSGLYSKQSTEPVCFARSPNCDEKADVMTNALQANWQNNMMPDLLVSEMEEMLYGGMSVVMEEWTTINGVEDAYTFVIEPSHFYFESAGIDPLHRDVELIGHFEDYSLGALAARFARSKYDYKQLEYIYAPYIARQQSILPNGQQTDKLKDPYWDVSDRDMCRVYHVWTKEHKLRYRCKDIMDFDQPLYRIEPEQLPLVTAENEARLAQAEAAGMAREDVPLIEYSPVFDTYWHYQALAPGGLILEEYDSPYEHGSHPYVFKIYEYINGDVIPYMSPVIDQQRYINRLVTLFDIVIQASAKGITMIPKSCVPNNMSEAEFARSIRETGNFIFYDDKEGRSMNKPEVVVSNTNMTGITDMLQLQLGFIPDITSVSEALQGKTAKSGTSASRYALESQNSTTSVSALLLKFGSFEQQVAEKKMQVIHQYYREGNISVMRSNGMSEVTKYDPVEVQDVKFGVRILMSPENPVFRMAMNDLVSQMWQAGAVDAAQMLQMSYLPASSTVRKQLEQAMAVMRQRSQQETQPQTQE